MIIPLRIFCVLALLATAASLQAADITGILTPIPAQVRVLGGTAPRDTKLDVVIDDSRADLGPEGYHLSCTKEGISLTAQTQHGAFYGRQTLEQLRQMPSIPCCEIADKPRMQIRGVMFDLARCKEKHEYYYHMIDQLSRWKINTVFLHLTDSGGCAIEIKKYPELATPYAFTQEEMKKLIEYAAERHIELIPEIESWGHASYITRQPRFAELAEGGRSTLCTSNPRTWEVLKDIYAEIAALFPSKYLHAGCDESDYGKCDQCKAKLVDGRADALVAEHLSKVSELVKTSGKIPMIWGDVLQSNRGNADSIPKDTIICYWNYKAQVGAEPAQFFKSKGFSVVGCPALVWGGRMILPAADTLDNVRSFTDVVLNEQCLGMETTVWIPQRYIPDTLSFGLAHAAELSWSGPVRDRLDFARAFCRSYFGIEPTTELAQTLLNVHQLSLKDSSIFTNLWNYGGQVAKLSTTQLAIYTIPFRDRAVSVAKALKRYRPKITKHKDEFDALILAADAAAQCGTRAVAAKTLTSAINNARRLVQEGESEDGARELDKAAQMLEELIARESDIFARIDAAWNKWRYADDLIKFNSGQNMVKSFTGADRFMKLIAPRLREAAQQLRTGSDVDWQGIMAEPKER